MDSDFLPSDIINHLQDSAILQKDIRSLPKKELQDIKKKSKLFNQADKKQEELTDREKEIKSRNVPKYEELEPSLLDENYFLKKHELIKFIDYNDHELKSLDEFDENQILFPTKYPHSRYEVKCLVHTLYRMLDNIGNVDNSFNTFSVETYREIDILKENIQKLDQIYQIILHEIARQISTSSKSRSVSIIELRSKYKTLTEAVPKELDRLKQEMCSQLENDANLKQKIIEFQASILELTDELVQVRDRDDRVTKNAETIQSDLEAALMDSKRSKELLEEYHVLYELQRQRLEAQMSSINLEKEDWTTLAFASTLKICDESLLNTSKRLRLITKKLIQISQHFAIFISDCDTQLTSKIQDLIDKSLKTLTKVHINFNKLINNFHDIFQFIKNKFKEFREKELINSKTKVNAIKNQIASLRGFLIEDSVRIFLEESNEEHLSEIEINLNEVEKFYEQLLKELESISNRKRIELNESLENNQGIGEFVKEFSKIEVWKKEFHDYFRILRMMKPFFDDLKTRLSILEEELSKSIEKYKNITNEEIILENIYPIIDDLYLETFQVNEFECMSKNQFYDRFNRFYGELQRNGTRFSKAIDQYDGELTESIHGLQDKVTKWLIAVLFLLTNLTSLDDIEARYKDLCEQFEEMMKIDAQIIKYSMLWTEKMAEKSGTLDSKSLELNEYKEEDDEWRNVTEMLIKDIGQKIEEELLHRRKRSEKMIAEMTYDDVESVIAEIKAKSTEKDVYLALETVGNLQDEVKEALDRINESNQKKSKAASELADARLELAELEEKMAYLIKEYQDYVK